MKNYTFRQSYFSSFKNTDCKGFYFYLPPEELCSRQQREVSKLKYLIDSRGSCPSVEETAVLSVIAFLFILSRQ